MNMETLGPDNFSDRTIEGEKVMRKNIRKAIILQLLSNAELNLTRNDNQLMKGEASLQAYHR